MAARLAVLLLVAACGQQVFETYGCACESRTYTKEEIAQYRADAARGDLEALAEMEEYYRWRAEDYGIGRSAQLENDRIRQKFHDERIARNDPKALEKDINDLIFEVELSLESRSEKLTALRQARQYALRMPEIPSIIDLQDDDRKDIDAVFYIDREIAALERASS
jgi:hypothetical protein